MKDPTPPDIPWPLKITFVIVCVAASVGFTAGWEWFSDVREQAEECGP